MGQISKIPSFFGVHAECLFPRQPKYFFLKMLDDFQINVEMFLQQPTMKLMQLGDGALLFALYGYRETFKNLLLHKNLTDFHNNNCKNVPWWTL